MKNPKGFKKSLRKRSHHLLERTYSLRAKNEKLKYERMMIVDLKHFKFFRCTKRHTFNAVDFNKKNSALYKMQSYEIKPF